MNSDGNNSFEHVGSFPIREADQLFKSLQAGLINFEFNTSDLELIHSNSSRGTSGEAIKVNAYVSPDEVEAFHRIYQTLFAK